MKRRTKAIIVRLTEKEHAHLKQLSVESGLNMESLIRLRIDNYKINPRPDAAYLRVIQAISPLGNNLNQIAHLANRTGKITDVQLEQTLTIMEKVWDVVNDELQLEKTV